MCQGIRMNRTTAQTPPELPQRVSAGQDVVWQKVDGMVVLLGPHVERYYSLDDVGTRMWEALQERPDVPAALDRLQAIFDIDDETLRRDLATFVATLVDIGLLRVDD
jgi:hypothetical protein